jgi:NitT/TauT family transport system substrate-binding protein
MTMGFCVSFRPSVDFRLAAAAAAVALAVGPATAQTSVKFSIDFKFEGPSAPFLVALDRGYYKAEGLDVTIDTAAGSVEPITRLASGTYDMGFADINSLMKFRDQNPTVPLKPVFMVYNRPPFSIVSRKSRGVLKPKDLEGHKLGAPAADGAFAQWKIFVQANGIDASKVTVENVGFPVREPMLAAGQVDAITGFSFSSYINLKDRGVPVDDIVVLLMADYGVNLYGNTIIVSPKFASEHPDAVKGFLRAFLRGLGQRSSERGRFGHQAQRRRQEGCGARSAQNGAPRQYRDGGGQAERLRWRGVGAARQIDRPDRAHIRLQVEAQGSRYLRSVLPAARS